MKRIVPLLVVAVALTVAGCQKNSSESGTVPEQNTMQQTDTNAPAGGMNTNAVPMKGTNAP